MAPGFDFWPFAVPAAIAIAALVFLIIWAGD